MPRWQLHVSGQVQGVGFRPHVYRLAHALALAGEVRNDGDGVVIDIEGEANALRALHTRLIDEAPPLARVEAVQQTELPATGHTDFVICASRHGAIEVGIAPDAAVCAACLDELFDPHSRFYRYALLNCTHCGPRYSVTYALPYDRANTSLAPFALCPACEAAYHDPLDRRFHAQPTACPQCGPQVQWWDAHGTPLTQGDPIAVAAEALRAGAILAVKGLGGYHLVCDARREASVRRLRQRKRRPHKALALMVASRASLATLPLRPIPAEALTQLESPARPIVLLPAQPRHTLQLPGIAPGLDALGVMLPATPLQYLLFHELAGRPDGVQWLQQPQRTALVMTSANTSGEPMVIDEHQATAQLRGIVDGFLVHNRAIARRCDDSVLRSAPSGPCRVLRRARGLAPSPISLDRTGPTTLALGAHLKVAPALCHGQRAVLAPHLGDLNNAASCAALDQAAMQLIDLLRRHPERIACDQHPDFYSTHLAERLATQFDVPLHAVQHHHAHIGAIAAEHHWHEPLLGVVLDGFGLGTDGTAWGGELLRVEGADMQRLGWLRPLPLFGGDRAAREPWRLGSAVMAVLGHDPSTRWPQAALVPQLLPRLAYTSSAGRLFDAAAALLGICHINSYEGEAAQRLEALASQVPADAITPSGQDFILKYESSKLILDLFPSLAKLLHMEARAQGARFFHVTLVSALVEWISTVATQQSLRTVALGGGCFANLLLTDALRTTLVQRGFQVLEARQLPPGDGAIALGQLWIARQAEVASCV